MQKNENQFYSIISQNKNTLLNIKNRGSDSNIFSKFNKSRNLLIKIGNKTLSSNDSYKNNMLSNINDSKENPNKNEELYNNFINSSDNKKKNFINSVQLDVNYLSKFASNTIKSKIFWSLMDKKNNENNFCPLNKTPKKRKKIDFIKYKFLLGQRNYYQRYDYDFAPFYYKKKYPYLNRSSKKLNNKDKILKKFYLDPDNINAQSMKDIKDIKEAKENVSFSSIKNMKRIFPKANNIKKNNYTSIKIKKYNNSGILSCIQNKLNPSNNLPIEYNIRSIKNILFEKSKEIEEYNKLKEKHKIIDDGYNEYLNRISPSDSNRIINKIRKVNLKLRNKNNNKKLKVSKNIVIFNDIKDINRNIRKANRNNNSNLNINYNNSFDFKKLISNKNKFMEDINKNINIGNRVLRKKIMLE